MALSARPLRIAIIAGEASGDILGAGLIQSLSQKVPGAHFYGIGGPEMCAQGFHTHFPMESLSVMGLSEVIAHLPTLWRIRRAMLKDFLETPPDIFIGIDSPDFNLTIERRLRKVGIKTAHYVSPSVWAWRKRRIHTIKKSVDMMLTLLPFETNIYEENNVPVRFVGHPLADAIPLTPDRIAARKALDLPENATVVAIMPGSRAMELKHLAKIFLQTAQWCQKRYPDWRFVTALSSEARKQQFLEILQQTAPDLPIKITVHQAQNVLIAADVTLLASGTVTLQAMLCKCPMVVAYKLSALNYRVAQWLIKIKYFSLPNLIADKMLVPEFLQEAVTPENLGSALIEQFENRVELQKTFTALHEKLRMHANEKASDAVLSVLGRL